MKKLLILTMVLLMTLTLGACGKKSEDNQPTDLETKVVESQEETSDEKDVEVETEDESEVESEVEEETKETEEETEDETKVVEKETKETKETEKSTEKTTEKSAEKSTDKTKETSKDTTKPSYTKISDTVYAKSAVNVRSGPDKTHKSLGTLKKGQEVKRIGICDNGWGVIEFGGKEGYVSGNYLVKDKPVKETIEETKAPKATQPKQTQPKATEAPKATQPKETAPPETSSQAEVVKPLIPEGWIFEKSDVGSALNSTHKAQIDSWVQIWKTGGMSDDELKTKIQYYLAENAISYLKVDVMGNSFFISEESPSVDYFHVDSMPYAYVGVYSTGQKDVNSVGNHTIFYKWMVYIR